jgi:putative N-acetylmannosamine-6-phosphate epimerase
MLVPRHSLIVSAQAAEGNPLRGPHFMAAMARAAEQGGAAAIRAEGVADIAAIRAAVGLPIIGLIKLNLPADQVRITTSFEDAAAVIGAGADMVAIDTTLRSRNGPAPRELIARIRAELGKPVLADIATLAEGEAAAAAGADAVATTLAGYTAETVDLERPAIQLVQALAARLSVPVFAEGHYEYPAQVWQAIAAGAHAVVVGTAITNPREITRRFVAVMPGGPAKEQVA